MSLILASRFSINPLEMNHENLADFMLPSVSAEHIGAILANQSTWPPSGRLQASQKFSCRVITEPSVDGVASICSM